MAFIKPNLLNISLKDTTVSILYTTVARIKVVINAKKTSKSPINFIDYIIRQVNKVKDVKIVDKNINVKAFAETSNAI